MHSKRRKRSVVRKEPSGEFYSGCLCGEFYAGCMCSEYDLMNIGVSLDRLSGESLNKRLGRHISAVKRDQITAQVLDGAGNNKKLKESQNLTETNTKNALDYNFLRFFASNFKEDTGDIQLRHNTVRSIKKKFNETVEDIQNSCDTNIHEVSLEKNQEKTDTQLENLKVIVETLSSNFSWDFLQKSVEDTEDIVFGRETWDSPQKSVQLENPKVIVEQLNSSFSWHFTQKSVEDTEDIVFGRETNFPIKLGLNNSPDVKINKFGKEPQKVISAYNDKLSSRRIYTRNICKKTKGFIEDSKDPNLFGLPNPGTNRCWFNASMQVIFGLRSFVEDIEYCMLHTEDTICDLFIELLKCRKQVDNKNFLATARTMSDKLHTLNIMYNNDLQQDSGEFFGTFYDHLKSKYDPYFNPVMNNIEFATVEKYICQGCGEKQTEYVNTMLFLSIINENGQCYNSIQEAIDAYSSEKFVDDFCNNCKGLISTKSTFTNISRYLTIQLLRYRQSMKLDQPVIVDSVLRLNNCVSEDVTYEGKRFPKGNLMQQKHLNIEEDVCKNDSNSENSILQYRPVGIIYHVGNSPFSGHYTCDVFHGASWYHYDDLTVTKFSLPEWNTCAYIIIYENVSAADTATK